MGDIRAFADRHKGDLYTVQQARDALLLEAQDFLDQYEANIGGQSEASKALQAQIKTLDAAAKTLDGWVRKASLGTLRTRRDMTQFETAAKAYSDSVDVVYRSFRLLCLDGEQVRECAEYFAERVEQLHVPILKEMTNEARAHVISR